MNFQIILENEAYKSVYRDKNTNSTFKQFLYNLLNISEATFPNKYKSNSHSKNEYIPQAIKIFCEGAYTSLAAN